MPFDSLNDAELFVTASLQTCVCGRILSVTVVLYYNLTQPSFVFICSLWLFALSFIIKRQSWGAASLLRTSLCSNLTVTVPQITSVALQVKGVSLRFRMKGKEVVGGNNLKWFPVESNESMLLADKTKLTFEFAAVSSGVLAFEWQEVKRSALSN